MKHLLLGTMLLGVAVTLAVSLVSDCSFLPGGFSLGEVASIAPTLILMPELRP